MGWWVVSVTEMPRLFPWSRTLVEVAEMVRDALTMCPGVEANPASATVAFFSQA